MREMGERTAGRSENGANWPLGQKVTNTLMEGIYGHQQGVLPTSPDAREGQSTALAGAGLKKLSGQGSLMGWGSGESEKELTIS